MSHDYPGTDLEAMAFAHNYHRWIRDRFRPYLGRRVAEVGAGLGDFSQLLLDAGIEELDCYEPSAELNERLRRRFNGDPRVRVVGDTFLGSPPRHGLDTVLYINVLEHIADDQLELANACGTLRQGGHLCVFVPALRWLYGEQDRRVGHFRRYRRRELLDRVRRAGFNVVECRWFDIAGVLPWWFSYRLLGRSVTPGAVGLYDRFVVPVMRRIESAVPPPVGKNLLLVARA